MLFRELYPMVKDVLVEYLGHRPACKHDSKAKGCYKSRGLVGNALVGFQFRPM